MPVRRREHFAPLLIAARAFATSGWQAGRVPQVSRTPASFSFCCLVLKSTGDSMPLFACLQFGFWNISKASDTSGLAALRWGSRCARLDGIAAAGIALGEIARPSGHHEAHICTRGPPAFLSPPIQTAIRDGSQPVDPTLERRVRCRVPHNWQVQERPYGFQASAPDSPLP